jgi:hypothetical protein
MEVISRTPSEHATKVRSIPAVTFLFIFYSLQSQVLRLEPSDKDALQTKLFLLLQTEQYSTALTLADSTEHAFEFGRAYALYRLHREHEAAAVLDEIKSTAGLNRGVNHLEAQLVRTSIVPPLFHILFISELHFTEL